MCRQVGVHLLGKSSVDVRQKKVTAKSEATVHYLVSSSLLALCILGAMFKIFVETYIFVNSGSVISICRYLFIAINI